MRQVPQNLNSSVLLLVGSGRLAMHLSYYFELEKISFKTWSRKSQDSFELKSLGSQIVLLAISDAALAEFVHSHRELLKDKICLHFSGALQVEGAWGVHPLMTFSDQKYDLEIYRSIHFVLEKGAPALRELIPQLANPFSYIANEKRALYHALCSLSGNFSVLLWEYAIQRFEKDLGLNGQALTPYLRQTSANIEGFAKTQKSVLTGPLVRKDFGTIEKHLAALSNDPMKQVYEAFVKFYQLSREEHTL